MAPPTVYLVGAGPGDPEALTLRGRWCLSVADLVIYDHLANPALLRFAPDEAERVFAGKHGSGPHLMGQDEIQRALIEGARAGRTVVRLKGGDPFLFGRGAEEAEALREAGIPYEVVPGVSSAIGVPAWAGVPVTHRDWVSGVTVLTGHEAHDRHRHAVHWDHVAQSGTTIVLLMAARQLQPNLDRLVAAGLDGTTPAIAIEWGGTPRQRTVSAPVQELHAAVDAAGLGPPLTVVIGAVAALRPRLEWFESRPLFGRRVVVTRARAQAARLVDPLRHAGADVIECPAIEIVGPADVAPVDAALARLSEYDWVVFTSVNGVKRFFARLSSVGGDVRGLGGAKIAAIGPETARALRDRHLQPDVTPAEFVAEGLLAELGGASLRGQRVLLPRAQGARPVLPEVLRERGATVDEVLTYRATRPEESVRILESAVAAGPIDLLTFTSSSTVRHFMEIVESVGVAAKEAIRDARVACIGPITAETARELGLTVDAMPESYTIPALAEAAIRILTREEP